MVLVKEAAYVSDQHQRMKTSPMNLKIIKKDNSGYELWIDDQRMRFIESYQINSSKGCTAELTLKMLVNYPSS